jgi:lysozyme family protein
MGNFESSFQKVLQNEGGYVNDPEDPGGETYKGVARKIWSAWDGWLIIDYNRKQSGFPANLEKDPDLQEKVKDFYRVNFWDKINGSNINDDEVAASIFDFAVNAGVSTSAGIAQMIVETERDGVIGKNTIKKINEFDPEHFLALFTISKVARYISIVKKRPVSQKYFFGWVCRALGQN